MYASRSQLSRYHPDWMARFQCKHREVHGFLDEHSLGNEGDRDLVMSLNLVPRNQSGKIEVP